MDRQERTLNVVKALNSYNNGELPSYKLLDEVCDFFDFVKDEELGDADKRFLLYLSNKVGVPHYYDILNKFNENYHSEVDDESIDLNTFSSLLYESSLFTDETSKLHRYQLEVLNLFAPKKQNRFFLSASTSFGKTHLVYEIIKKMGYKNIILIFPSIALLSENLVKVRSGFRLPLDYKVHTLSDLENNFEGNNIFIFTPERFLSFLDKNVSIPIDFIFVDEVYKIDNGYIIDNETRENERDVAYRMAIFHGLAKYPKTDLLLAGPYIEVFTEDSPDYNPSFDTFLRSFGITKLLMNEYEIVKVSKAEIEGVKERITIDGVEFDFKKKKTKRLRIQEILDRILERKENAIVYCNTPANAEIVSAEFEKPKINTELFTSFLEHLKSKFESNWIIIEALEKGVGVHHGLVPKYIQKEIISLFNSKEIAVDVLFSTTTITEGVNTTSKNMVVYKSEKGQGKGGKPLLTFDAKNIAGRAGRFMEHYKGRVISLEKIFLDTILKKGNQIEHKNYEFIQDRKEIDDEMTPAEYLDDRSKLRIEELNKLQNDRGIPDEVITLFKVISRRVKISIYDEINSLSPLLHARIRKLISELNSPQSLVLNKEGFQAILNILEKYIENETLQFLIERKYKDKNNIEASILYAAMTSYLYEGFGGVYRYHLERMKKVTREIDEEKKEENSEEKKKETNAKRDRRHVNSAMRLSSTLIYNTFKYQLVKYLGVFNLMYKFWESKRINKHFNEVTCIDRLLIKLEYNAFSPAARVASDFGVPQKIIDYYDAGPETRGRILNSFDNYEKQVHLKIKGLVGE